MAWPFGKNERGRDGGQNRLSPQEVEREIYRLGSIYRIEQSNLGIAKCIDDRTKDDLHAMRVPGGNLGDIGVVKAALPHLSVSYIIGILSGGVVKKRQRPSFIGGNRAQFGQTPLLYGHAHARNENPLETCGHLKYLLKHFERYGFNEENAVDMENAIKDAIRMGAIDIDTEIHDEHTAQTLVKVITEYQRDGAAQTFVPKEVGTTYVFTQSIGREINLARQFTNNDDEVYELAARFTTIRKDQAEETVRHLGGVPNILNVHIDSDGNTTYY